MGTTMRTTLLGLLITVILWTGTTASIWPELAGTAVDAASQPTGNHWRRSTGKQTIIWIKTPCDQTRLTKAIKVAAKRWNPNPKIDLRPICKGTDQARSKQYPIHNVTNVKRGDRHPGIRSAYAWYSGWADKHIAEGWIVFDWSWGGAPFDGKNSLVNATCHEIGHTLGLNHPSSGPGPCKNGYPDTQDHWYVAAAHQHRDDAGPKGSL